jgi:hypothetical protein
MKYLLLRIILLLSVFAGVPMVLGVEPTTPPKEAPPRTPETGIDPGIRVDPGPSPDPRASIPPKFNPDPGMAINPDVVPGGPPKTDVPADPNSSSVPGKPNDSDKKRP